MEKKRKLMLISPMLHQGGFERVCITTARLLEPYFDITIVIFDSSNIGYDIEGLHIIDLNLGVQRGKVRKILNIIKRSRRLRTLKKEMKPDIAYSFGPTANMVNSFSKTKNTKVWLGIRSYMDMGEPVKIVDLAKNLILLSGHRPDDDIPIVYTGLRPGEKLYEEILMEEEGLQDTENKLIHIGRPIKIDEEKFLRQLKNLADYVVQEPDDIRKRVQEMVTTYHPWET